MYAMTLMFATLRASPPVPGVSVTRVYGKADTLGCDFSSDMLFKRRRMVSKSSCQLPLSLDYSSWSTATCPNAALDC